MASARILGLALVVLVSTGSQARGDPPPDEGVLSVQVTMREALVRRAPDRNSPAIGLLVYGARFPFRGEQEGPGCDGAWYRIEPDGWACREVVAPSARAPHVPRSMEMEPGDVLPYRYGFARRGGARLYMRSRDHVDGEPHREVPRGFGFGIRRAVRAKGRLLWRVRSGRYVLQDEIALVRPIDFRGVTIPDGQRPPLAWTHGVRTPVQAEPGCWDRWRALVRLAPRTPLEVVEERRIEDTTWLRVSFEPRRRSPRSPTVDGGWVADRYVRRVGYVGRPEGVGSGSRWIDVDRSSQTLVAYHGDVPLYATMISTGRRWNATPPGLHRVEAKHAWTKMDNVEASDPERLYAFEDVPWVQYFHQGIALHAALWHEAFGYRVSHGCVNLAPHDARFLFDWTVLKVPPGWTARFATEERRGTLVRVR